MIILNLDVKEKDVRLFKNKNLGSIGKDIENTYGNM